MSEHLASGQRTTDPGRRGTDVGCLSRDCVGSLHRLPGKPLQSDRSPSFQRWSKNGLSHGSTGHLVHKGAYAALQRLDIPDKGKTSNCRFWHGMLTFLAGSNGGRLSHAERFDWESVRGLFGGHNGLSASFLRDRLHQIADAARDETVTVEKGK